MLAVLVTAARATSVTRSALTEQQYERDARLAAESGLAMLRACVDQLDGELPSVSRLRTGQDCEGNGAADYVQQHDDFRTWFVVEDFELTSDGATISATATGYAEQLRRTDGEPWNTYEVTQSLSWTRQRIQEVSLSRTHSCVLATDRQVYCAGRNAYGQLGVGHSSTVTVPTQRFQLPDGLHAVAVATGEDQTCVTANDSQVYCAGRNHVGQLGDGSTTHREVPVRFRLPAGRNAEDVQIAVNLFRPGSVDDRESRPYTCVRATNASGGNGQVYCAGANQHGQLGNGERRTAQSTPTRFGTPSSWNIQDFAVGASALNAANDDHSHTCVRPQNRELWCAGLNTHGQLGDGTTADRASPVRFSTNINSVDKVYVWFQVTCIVGTGGGFWCAGNNRAGRFGIGEGQGGAHSTPVSIFTGLGGIREAALGPNQICALTRTDRVYCAGAGTYGRLGNNSGHNSSTPVRFTHGVGTVRLDEVHIGDIQTCVLTTVNRDVYCAGFNSNGQLGIGTFTDNHEGNMQIPVGGRFQLPSGQTAAEVFPGMRSTCVQTTSGRSYCAGSNQYGQLGNDVTSDQAQPVEALLIDPPPMVY